MAKVAAVSGYKPFELGVFKKDDPAVGYIKAALKRQLQSLAEEGLEWVIISGQLGVELWAAEVVFDIQEEFPNLKLSVITPFLAQETNWKDENKEWYESILMQADHVDSLTKKPYQAPWQFRAKNQFFVGKSDVLLLLFDPEKDGSPRYLYETAQKYQAENTYEIRLIDFYDLQLIVEEEALRKADF
ncbi:DUF1273 domain-containing protein [Mesobacillus harenae]|uniref:DUF1273 domain-containing protein n=1 Tax=Mesobacillus harenae TaxID=2213203 RepID=UPI00157FEF18|nr:DUF1273 domain-containing protein [Mesobacillus harenae]